MKTEEKEKARGTWSSLAMVVKISSSIVREAPS